MRKWTKTASLLFLATASVYSDGANVATVAASDASSGGRDSSTEVKVLGDAATDPLIVVPAASPGAVVPDTTVPPVSTPAEEITAAAPSPAQEQPTIVKPAKTGGHSVTTSEVNVNAAGTVEIHVNDASLVEVLRMLSMQSQKNIIATKDVTGTVTANLYNVTVRQALDAILKANGFAYREQGNFIYIYTQKHLAEIERSERKMETAVLPVYYTRPSDAVKMLLPVLSKDAQIAQTPEALAGIATGSTDVGGNTHSGNDVIVITDYPENLAEAKKILKKIDQRPQQVLIEATIMAATLTEDNALGIDFNVVGGVDFSSLTSASGQITNAELPPPDTSGTSSAVGNTKSSVGTGTNFTSGINGFRAGIVTDNLSVFLSALEGVTDTTILANPKVLVLNKQKGEVHIGSEDGYRGTTTQTETAATESVQFLSTGVRLIFRPYVGNDGYIRMEVHPEDSSGSVDKTTGLPSKTTTDVTSNIMVKDGHTVVIGGLFREVNRTDRSQIPFLGDLPIAGYLFRKQADSTVRQEVIILLTPHIVKDDSAYADASLEAMKEMEKLRVGVRKGMMPWGRERLAECWYEKAVAEMHKPSPDRKKAIWYLGCATDLNPKFVEAIDLKQTLTGHEVTAVDNSVIRDFVQKQILLDQARPTTAPSSLSSLEPPVFPVHPSRPLAESPTLAATAASTPSSTKVTTSVAVTPITPIAPSAPSTRPVALVPSPILSAAKLDPVTPLAPTFSESSAQPATRPVAQGSLDWVWTLCGVDYEAIGFAIALQHSAARMFMDMGSPDIAPDADAPVVHMTSVDLSPAAGAK